jgi:histidinol-phosphatase
MVATRLPEIVGRDPGTAPGAASGRVRGVYEHELAFAVGLAERASVIGMSVFRGDVQVRLKADRTPVTRADTEIESMIREQVAAAFPDDGVFGEEHGGDAADAGRVWVVDPIDATANFARGIPVWATLIALQVDGEPVLGVVDAPALGERYEAVRGGGARCNGDPIRVSETAELPEAQLLYADVRSWTGTAGAGVLSALSAAGRTRGFGDFWGHVLVARGSAEAMVEPELSVWDYAAFVPVVREAGGRVTAIDGGPLRHRGSVLSSNGAIHDELIARFATGTA